MKRKVHIRSAALIKGEHKDVQQNCLKINEEQYLPKLEGYSFRGMDRIGRLVLASAAQALKDSELSAEGEEKGSYGFILGTAYGALDSIHSFDMVSVEKGALGVNPSLFPNTVLNSPACQAGIQLSIAAPIYTVCNGLNSSLDAIGLGYESVSQGAMDCVITGGVDEVSMLQTMMHPKCNPIGEASGFLVLDHVRDEESVAGAGIIGYGSVSFADGDYINTASYTKELVDSVLHRNDIKVEHLDNISFSTFLPVKDAGVFCDGICRSIGFNKDFELMDRDWLGANGIVQVVSAINNLNGSNAKKTLSLIIGVDKDKAAALILSKGI